MGLLLPSGFFLSLVLFLCFHKPAFCAGSTCEAQRVNDTALSLSDCIFIDLSAQGTNNGGAIMVSNSGQMEVTISETIFYYTRAPAGNGGCCWLQVQNPNIANCCAAVCWAHGYGQCFHISASGHLGDRFDCEHVTMNACGLYGSLDCSSGTVSIFQGTHKYTYCNFTKCLAADHGAAFLKQPNGGSTFSLMSYSLFSLCEGPSVISLDEFQGEGTTFDLCGFYENMLSGSSNCAVFRLKACKITVTKCHFVVKPSDAILSFIDSGNPISSFANCVFSGNAPTGEGVSTSDCQTNAQAQSYTHRGYATFFCPLDAGVDGLLPTAVRPMPTVDSSPTVAEVTPPSLSPSQDISPSKSVYVSRVFLATVGMSETGWLDISVSVLQSFHFETTQEILVSERLTLSHDPITSAVVNDTADVRDSAPYNDSPFANEGTLFRLSKCLSRSKIIEPSVSLFTAVAFSSVSLVFSTDLNASFVQTGPTADFSTSIEFQLSRTPVQSHPLDISAFQVHSEGSKDDHTGTTTESQSWLWGVIASVIFVVIVVTLIGIVLFRRSKLPPPKASNDTIDGIAAFWHQTAREEATEIDHAFDNPLAEDSEGMNETAEIDGDGDDLPSDVSESMS
jgi:hypothetical protein